MIYILFTLVLLAFSHNSQNRVFAISVSRHVSSLSEGNVLLNLPVILGGSRHSIDYSISSQLVPKTCPNNTFGIQSGKFISLGPLPQNLLKGPPFCINEENLVGVQAYGCVIVYERNNVDFAEIVTINIYSNPTEVTYIRGEYYGSVLENSTNAAVSMLEGFVAVSASDGKFTPLLYHLTSETDKFDIVTETIHCMSIPTIITTVALDVETMDTYHLTVVASHPLDASYNDTTTVIVTVLDVNEYQPEFTTDDREFSVDNTAAIGTKLGNVTATDGDGVNNFVRYRLKEANEYFRVESVTGELIVSTSLLSLEDETITLIIVAYDDGSPPLSAKTSVTVQVVDSAASLPTVTFSSTNITVTEHLPSGTSLIDIEINSTLLPLLNLDGFASNLFALFEGQPPSRSNFLYQLIINGDISREKYSSEIALVVTITYDQDGRFDNTTDIFIMLTDINDNPPEFSETSYEVYVYEGTPENVAIFIPIVTDKDLGMNVNVTFALSSPSPLFKIDPLTGSIFTRKEVPFGTSSTTLIMVATDEDGRGLATSASLTITTLSFNAAPPVFTNPTPLEAPPVRSFTPEVSLIIAENFSPNDPIYTFAAVDNDDGCNGRISYSIVQASPNVVRINSFTGELYASGNRSLDYEKFRVIDVTVRASDYGYPFALFSEAHIRITLTDADDNPPVIDEIGCPCFLKEGVGNQQFCPRLSLSDADEGGARVKFKITSGNNHGHFVINSTTGQVSTSPGSVLDREMQSNYNLSIITSEDSNTVTLRVIVVDVKDTSISYGTVSSLPFQVPKNTEIGSLVGSVAVTHRDAGFNGLVTYSGAVTGAFLLDTAKGDLYVTGSLAEGILYSFNIVARDRTQTSLSSSVTLRVTVTEPEPTAPTFSTQTDQVLIPRNLQVGATIYQFTASTEVNSARYASDTLPSLFAINQENGKLTLMNPLGASPSVYSLNVTASISGHPELVAHQLLEITIYEPRYSFSGASLTQPIEDYVCQYTWYVPEQSIGSAQHLTLDESFKGIPLSYTLETTEYSAPFFFFGTNEVHIRNGFSSIFDLEVRQSLFLTILARYSSNFFRCSITVLITDINNHAPKFDSPNYSIEIYSNSPVGTVVFKAKAIDKDKGINAITTYSFTTSNSHFSIDAETGIIQVAQLPSTSETTIGIVATDSNKPSLSSETTLRIVLLDLTNAIPDTGQQMMLSVQEDTAPGTLLTSVSASDLDVGIHGRLSYCILNGNIGNRFRISETGGAIHLSKELDYDNGPRNYNLDILVYDTSENPQSNPASVLFTVTPVNEPPLFLSEVNLVGIEEDSPPLTHVISVKAEDEDNGDPGVIAYDILKGNSDSHFTINSETGDIYISELVTLDRESMDLYNLTVVAGNPPFDSPISVTSTVEISIQVIDVNDNPPRFNPSSRTIRIKENTPRGQIVHKVEAEDEDSPVNSDIYYSIMSGNEDGVFALNGLSGDLVVVKDLDYETGNTLYQLEIEAIERGISTSASSLTVVIQILNVNDHIPQFSSLIFHHSIPENLDPGTFVGTVSAYDLDREGNSLTYSLLSSHFVIDNTGAVTSSVMLDREDTSEYYLEVTAADSGTPGRTATAILHITVSDENDEPPILEEQYVINVSDDHPINSPFFAVKATDNDEGYNAAVSYTISMQSNASLWGIHPNSGFLYLKQVLDYSSVPFDSFKVQATNMAAPFKSAETTIFIHVLDTRTNTLPPQFPQTPTSISILGNTSVDYVIATFPTTDKNGDAVNYGITGGSGIPYFRIDSSNGDLYLLRKLATPESLFILNLQITDQSAIPLSTFMQVLISVSSSPLLPKFTSPVYSFSVEELTSLDTFVGVVTVIEDRYHSSIIYSLISETNVFNLNSSSGVLTVASASINRNLAKQYQLEVSAHSEDFPTYFSHTLVLVSVVDKNNHRPVFYPSPYSISVFTSHPMSRPVVKVVAGDLDDPDNFGRVTIESESPPSAQFSVSSNGEIYSTSVSLVEGTYAVGIIANDNNGFTTNSNVTIQVISPSGFAEDPQFTSTSDDISVTEDKAIGDIVATATASDSDSGILVYRLLDSSTPTDTALKYFAIHPNTGDIFVAKLLDRELVSQFLLRIEAWDGQNTALYALTVDIADVNDVRPIFSQSIYRFEIPEDASLDSVVDNVDISDLDLNSNSEVDLQIVDTTSPDGLFQISSKNLVLKGDLNREENPGFTVTIRASDRGSPSLINYCRIEINVTDINNFVPSFTEDMFSITVSESTPPGSYIFSVPGYDLDLGSNGTIDYSLQQSNKVFSIGRITGSLSTIQALNFAQQPVYNLTVIAADRSTVSLNTMVTVLIHVLPDYSSPPSILNPNSVTIKENLPFNTYVTSLSVDTKATLYYRLVSGNEEGHFWIDQKTGLVWTTSELDREQNELYSLTAAVHYFKNPKVSNSVSFTVIVSDVNDNPPMPLDGKHFAMNFSEASLALSQIATLSFTDPDAGGGSGAVDTVVILSNEASEVFDISTSGSITLLTGVDFDRGKKQFDFFIAASDVGSPMQLSIHHVHLDITDANDENPVFSQNNYSSVLLTPTLLNTKVTKVYAADLDPGDGGVVDFEIRNGNEAGNFGIDSSGVIRLTSTYNPQPFNMLEVRAFDNGVPQLSATTFVKITVRNCPLSNFYFDPSIDTLSVLESEELSTVLLRPNLVHPGISGSVVGYSITTVGSPFIVNSVTGAVRLQESLDHESIDQYQLAIQAKHQSDSSIIADLFIMVTVIDVNDNTPQFLNEPYIVFLTNDVTSGEHVIRVTAEDSDLGEGGRILYRLTSGNFDHFSINSISGEITVANGLTDLPPGRTISLTIEASDHGTPALMSTTFVNVSIVDSRAPRFDNTSYRASVPENALIGAYVTTVAATVRSQGGFVTYTAETGGDIIQFNVDFYTGEVTVARELDYEMQSKFILTIKASDPTLDEGSSGFTTLTINVLDYNDNPPIFSSSLYPIPGSEDAKLGTQVTTVTASDLDAPSTPNSQLSYSLSMNSQHKSIFDIDSDTGQIILIDNIDYESFPIYEFIIEAVDSGIPSLTGSTTVRLSVINVNDNPPSFLSNPFLFSVQETAHHGSIVGTVSASDADGDAVTYFISSGSPIFSIDRQSGDIRLNLGGPGLLLTQYNITVGATDGNFTSNAAVLIFVTDINDNPPVFTDDVYEVNITENIIGIHSILQVSATDQDRITDNLEYKLPSDLVQFIINSNDGTIFVTQSLNREVEPVIEFRVFVTDGRFTSNALVRVLVLDENDNAPVFDGSVEYSAQVSESVSVGAVVATVRAVDSDQGSNGTVTYTLGTITQPAPLDRNQFPFFIEPSGEIKTRATPNFESQNKYTFYIIATDGGAVPMSNSVLFTIDILNEADTSPEFTQSSYTFTVTEPNNNDMSVGQISATLPDLPDASIRYRVFPKNSNFDIDQDSGIISLKKDIDREDTDEQVFSVIAEYITSDFRILKNSVTVTVTVGDINDEAPFFTESFFQAQVRENEPPNTPVTRYTVGQELVEAQDGDAGENGTVRYQIETGDVPFVVAANGQILTTTSIDRETRDIFIFEIRAFDGGTPQMESSGTLQVQVRILDVNDNPPVFMNTTKTVTINEDAEIGDEIVILTATDKDSEENAQVVYSLKGSENFQIDEEDGTVRVVKLLDRETQETHNITVDAYDGTNRATIQLTVTVLDVNDVQPVFSKSLYTVVAVENAVIGIPLLAVHATDVDQIGDISYSILSGPSSANFSINSSSGEVSFRISPDYESSQSLEVQVVASDGEHEVLVPVRVNINDTNDEFPSFSQSLLTGNVTENRQNLTNVIKILASDPDSGLGGLIMYEIIGGRIAEDNVSTVSELPFYIYPFSGLIVTIGPLDRETVDHYTILVSASDQGTPSLSSTAEVAITVLDQNDHSPAFEHMTYSVPVSETADVESEVLTVVAVDQDIGSNADIFYAIESGAEDFTVDPHSGIIRINSKLDFESVQTYNLSLVAYDGGTEPKSARATLFITVIDENDNRPIFTRSAYLEIIPENTAVGTIILQVEAQDRDTGGAAGAIIYSIVASIPQFTINSKTGEISIAQQLDFEMKRSHIFEVRAENEEDSSGSSLSDTRRVNVTLTDVNDVAPRFSPPNATYILPENGPSSMTIATIIATDIDTVTDQNAITFEIQNRNDNDGFQLDRFTGILSSTKSFDRETTPKFRLIIIAEDHGEPSLTGTTFITVEIEDVNDNRPTSGGHTDITIYHLGDVHPASIIGYINGNDPDLVNDHTYTIHKPETSGQFLLHTNGSISSQANPKVGHYTFEVNVTEFSTWALSSVKIVVDYITKAHITNSITIRIRDMTVENFLRMINGFTAVMPSMNLIVLSVQPGPDGFLDEVDVSVVEPLQDGEFNNPELLRHLIHINRDDFAKEGFNIVTELLDACVGEPCGGNGLCRNIIATILPLYHSQSLPENIVSPTAVWDYDCECLPGYSGGDCELGSLDECISSPCPNPMHCVNSDEGYHCKCPLGSDFDGNKCNVNLTACGDFGCMNGATCGLDTDGLNCECGTNFVGRFCSIPTESQFCQFTECNGGTCTDSHVGFTCSCPLGKTGKICEVSSDHVTACSQNPCKHGGSCTPSGDNYQCTCPEGYTGADCSVFIYDKNKPSKCDLQNCTDEEDCVTEDEVAKCINFCSPNPCQHGGKCIRQRPGYTCSCPKGHQGPKCEVILGNIERPGYGIFSSINSQVNLSVYLEFATNENNGLLLLFGRYDREDSDKLTLEVVSGKLLLSLSRGGTDVTSVAYNAESLSDKQWHSVLFGFNSSVSPFAVNLGTCILQITFIL